MKEMNYLMLFKCVILIMAYSMLTSCSSDSKKLHSAAFYGNISEAKKLIDKGADVNWEDTTGTALHQAAYKGHIKMAQLLIDNGADINARIKESAARVFFNAFAGFFGDIDVRNAFGATPLHAAVNGSQREMVKWLLSKGARRDIPLTLSAHGWEREHLRSPLELANEEERYGISYEIEYYK
jgi:ankyrin repeat protein